MNDESSEASFSPQGILGDVLHVFNPDSDDYVLTEHGFDWWPGSHRVHVACLPEWVGDELSYKLSVSTAFIKEFNFLDSRLAALAAHMSAMAST